MDNDLEHLIDEFNAFYLGVAFAYSLAQNIQPEESIHAHVSFEGVVADSFTDMQPDVKKFFGHQAVFRLLYAPLLVNQTGLDINNKMHIGLFDYDALCLIPDSPHKYGLEYINAFNDFFRLFQGLAQTYKNQGKLKHGDLPELIELTEDKTNFSNALANLQQARLAYVNFMFDNNMSDEVNEFHEVETRHLFYPYQTSGQAKSNDA